MTIHARRILLASLFCAPALWDAPAQAGDRTGGFLQQADQNGDGIVTRAEVTALRDMTAAKLDADKDGFITVAEIKTSVLAKMSLRAEQMAAARIAAADGDGDGRLSLIEVQGSTKIDRLFARADQDGDGALSQIERTRLAAKWAHKKADCTAGPEGECN